MARPGLTGVLLIGGASRRFGSPKALAILDGEMLAELAWRVLGEACGERLAVGKLEDHLSLPFVVHDDGIERRAPLAGVIAALRLATTDVCVFLPVDCPRVTPALLLALADACSGDAAVPQTGPLPGAYRRTALPVLEQRLDAGEFSLRDALPLLDAAVVHVDPALLANVNTPDDLRELA